MLSNQFTLVESVIVFFLESVFLITVFKLADCSLVSSFSKLNAKPFPTLPKIKVL